MSDPKLVKAINRLAAAVERLTAVPGTPPATPCARCSGQGWLGNTQVACHVCEGTGLQPVVGAPSQS